MPLNCAVSLGNVTITVCFLLSYMKNMQCNVRALAVFPDVEYSIDNPSNLDDISVIDFGGRFRRQADDPTVTDHTEEATTPKNPTVVDDTKPDFGQRLFPEEYDVKHASSY